MRKFLSLLTMCVLAVTAIHAETFVMADYETVIGQALGTNDQGYYQNGDFVVTLDAFTMDVKGNNGQTKPTFHKTDKDVRTYAKNSLQFTTTGNAMTQIVFYISTQGKKRLATITASSGSVTYDTDLWTVTWTGTATDVTFTVGDKADYGTDGNTKAGQLDFLSLVINTGEVSEVVANPVITPTAGTYYAPINVAINCGTVDANIYYTTNGSTPTASSTLYSAPFEVSTNTTVKAIAIKGNLQSEVVEAAYVFETATPVANIAAYQTLDDDTYVVFSNPVTVLGHNGQNLYVKDASGYALFYGNISPTKYNTGNIIPAGFTGNKTTYAGEPELAINANSNFQASSGDETVEPETIQVADIEADMFAHYVYLPGVTLDKETWTISDNSGEGQFYSGMGASGINSVDASKTYNVWGVIGSRNVDNEIIYRVLPMKIEEVGGTDPTPTDGVATIAEYQALPVGTQFTFTGSAVVTYVDPNDKRYVYIKDATGSSLIYGTNAANGLKQGDVLASGWTGKTKNLNGLYEVETPANLAASGQTQTVTPVEYTTANITAANQNIYCVLRGVKIASVNGRNFTFEDGAAGYNTFNSTVILPSDLDQTYDIEGFVSVYNNPQFIPTRFLTEVSIPKVADIAALFETENGTYEIESDITAIYQNGLRLFVKDADTYTLVYGAVNGTFTNGDIIRGAQASWTDYQGVPQIIPVGSTFIKAASGTPVQPEVMAIEELGTDMVHMYVKLDDVALVNDTENNRYATVTDETGSIQLYNQFNNTVTMPEDGNYNVVGFVSIYEGTIQVYPVEFITGETPVLPVGDLTGDKIVDVEDVNAIINIILKVKTQADYPGNADLDGNGIIDVEDMNIIINIILSQSH